MKVSVTVVHHLTEIRTHHFPGISRGHNRHISPFRIVIFHSLEKARRLTRKRNISPTVT